MRAEAKSAGDRGAGPRELALALGVGWSVYAWVWTRFHFVCDDAYISFRYARRLAEGQGLRFNLAEHPPVEGYSNLLWVLWLAPFEALGVDLRGVSTLTSGLCGALLLALCCRLAQRRLQPGALVLAAAAALLACLPPFAVWSSGGLETMAFALAVFAVFERLALEPQRPAFVAAGVAGMAAVLLRPDGVLWVVAALGAAVLAAPAPTTRRTLRACCLAGLLACAAVLGQLVFRLAYHHEWVANTVRAKSSISLESLERGGRYVSSLLLEQPFLLILPLALLVWRAARERFSVACALVVLFGGAYATAVGGDFMAMGRLVVPAMPFVALVFVALTRARPGARHPGAAVAVLGTAVLGCSLLSLLDASPVPQAWRQRVHFRWNEPRARSEFRQWSNQVYRGDEWARVGRALADHVTPGTPMYLPNLGAIAYYSEVHALDPFGLVSPQVARLAPSGQRASPGHDKFVDWTFFTDPSPVILSAWIAPRGLPLEEGVHPRLLKYLQAGGGGIERIELPPDSGFQPGEELRLARMP